MGRSGNPFGSSQNTSFDINHLDDQKDVTLSFNTFVSGTGSGSVQDAVSLYICLSGSSFWFLVSGFSTGYQAVMDFRQ